MTNVKLNEYEGGCYCGRVSFVFSSDKTLNELSPRACDCNFCVKAGVSYLSDSRGLLVVTLNSEVDLGKFTQGSNSAEFRFCAHCSVITHVTYTTKERVYAAINANCLEQRHQLGDAMIVSPKLLDKPQKIERWEQLWIASVTYKFI